MDRQDIDALLVGALYGELDSADEARLAAHLESHPADRAALSDMRGARDAVRESRFLTVQAEPPQALSALLLQEASRRAPKPVAAKDREPGWFARFVRSIAAHPAMASAAMLVVVLGVAGAMYIRDRSLFDEPVHQLAVEETASPAVAAAPRADDRHFRAPEAPRPADESKQLRDNAGSAYEAGLVDGKGEAKKEDAPAATKPTVTAAPKARPPARRGLEVASGRAEATPMDLESDDDASLAKDKQKREAVVDQRTDRGRSPKAAEPPPPPPPPPAPAPAAAAPAPTADVVTAEAGAGPGAGEDLSWARETRARVVTAVNAKNCAAAAHLAIELSTRTPNFYASNVANARDVKQCAPYINAELGRESERRMRAAPAKRATDAAAPAERKAP